MRVDLGKSPFMSITRPNQSNEISFAVLCCGIFSLFRLFPFFGRLSEARFGLREIFVQWQQIELILIRLRRFLLLSYRRCVAESFSSVRTTIEAHLVMTGKNNQQTPQLNSPIDLNHIEETLKGMYSGDPSPEAESQVRCVAGQLLQQTSRPHHVDYHPSFNHIKKFSTWVKPFRVVNQRELYLFPSALFAKSDRSFSISFFWLPSLSSWASFMK